MKHYWELACDWADGLSLRERMLMFLAGAFVLVALADFALLEPLYAQKQALTAQLLQRQEKYKEIQAQMEALRLSRSSDVQLSLKERLAELQQQAQQQQTYLQSRRAYLVAPDKMGALLEQVLHDNRSLQLLSLQTLPSEQPLRRQQGEAGTEIYRHGVRISVRGSYAELLRYVAELEKLPVQLLWGEISLQVERYPDSVLVLTLYTMSQDRAWLTL